MRVTTTSSNVLSNTQNRGKIQVDPSSFIQTYDLNDYMRSQSFLDEGPGGFLDPGGVSNLQVSPEIKEMLKEKFWRTWYHLKHVQAGPFAVYNNPTAIDVAGLFPVSPAGAGGVHPVATGQEMVKGVPGVPVETAQGLVAAGAIAPGVLSAGSQVHVVPGVGPVAVTPQVVSPAVQEANEVDKLNSSLDTKAVPTDLAVTASHNGDPNTPPLANVPVVNVIGGKTISAPGVIPSEVMDKHPLFSTNNLASNDYYKINVENVARALIVTLIVVFLIGGIVYRIKTKRKPKKKR